MYASRRSFIQNFIIYGVLILYLLFVLVPLVWVIVGSFKTTSQALHNPPIFIFKPILDAYYKVFQGGGLGKAFLHSFIIASGNVVLAFLLGAPAAYALARWQTKATDQAGFWILSLRMTPAFGVILPIYILMREAKLIDSLFSVMLVHLTINLPLSIWLLRGYFSELPEEVEESAKLDGAGQFQVLWYVVLPLSLPMLVAVSALVFMLSWNEFLFAFLLTSTNAVTVPVVITALSGTMKFDWPLMSALASLSLIPAFLFVAYLQRHIVRGLTMGAIK
jgi:ABC-type glycerol-3-phosphate transport system permease component